jgi:teichuronic acid biosynthesis glycosyltransferase TuaH
MSARADSCDVVLALCFVTWEDAVRRGMHFPPDRLIEALLHEPQVRSLVVADPFRDRARTLAKRALGRSGDPARGEDPARVTHLRPLRAGRRDPVDPGAVERLYRRYDARLARAAEAAGLRDPVLITTHPFVAGFAPARWARSVTYYVWDDWAAHPRHRDWRPAIEESHARIRASERRVCAVSQAILDRMTPTGPAALVPNGVDPREWRDIGEPPAWFAALPAPRLLYAGTLDARIDVRLVERTARAFPDGSVTLVGLIADEAHLAPLRDLPNVHIHPPVTRDAITAMIRAADAGLVPHARTDLTTAMSPLKVYEYLAGGRPVAATDLAPMRGIDPRVVLTPEGGDYAASVARALALGPAPERERAAFVAAHAWERRHTEILTLARADLDQCPGAPVLAAVDTA